VRSSGATSKERWPKRLRFVDCESLLGACSPVEAFLLTSLDLTDRRVVAHGTPDLLTELALSDIVTIPVVVYPRQQNPWRASRRLTAVEAARPLDRVLALNIIAVSNSTADR